MKHLRMPLAAVMILMATAAVAQSDAQKTFDRLKTLAGTWQGSMDGQPAETTYRLVSNGSAIMSNTTHDAMVSMFTLDGDRVLMTHYCGAGNQPRMVASASPDGKTITFDFLDATNLASPSAGHMHHAVFTFTDNDHYTEQWTWRNNGQDKVEQFALSRKK